MEQVEQVEQVEQALVMDKIESFDARWALIPGEESEVLEWMRFF